MVQRAPLTDEACQHLASLILLDRVIAGEQPFHAALLENDDAVLRPVFDQAMAAGLVDVNDEDRFVASTKGRTAYGRLLQMQQSYLVHFDIFAGVDLAEGRFADPERETLDDPRWADLRVAVAEYKGIDPHRMVFLATLADGRFFEERDWRFDLALGSSFFAELNSIVAEQLSVDELGYVAEDGEAVSGDSVLEDVILSGAAQVQAEVEAEHQQQPELFAGAGAANGEGSSFSNYDPLPRLAAYAASAGYVDALWLDPWW